MSNTRTAKPGSPLNQSKFSSSPEFNRGIMANLVASRCALLDSAADRELIWFVQYLSHQEGGLKKLAAYLIQKYGARAGTARMLELKLRAGQICNAEQVRVLRSEFPNPENYVLKGEYSSMDELILSIDGEESDDQKRRAQSNPASYPAKRFIDDCADALSAPTLEDWFTEFCVNPDAPLDRGPWYFATLVDCLREYQSEWVTMRRTRHVVTELGSLVEETLDYTLESRRMSLIDGLARTGKTFSTKAWCEQNPGRVRYVEVPSNSDEIGFFRAIAKSLGVSISLASKAQQLRLRIEETLQAGQLGLVLDEAQYIWPNQIDSRSPLPSRVNWIMTALVNKGVPVCLITTPQFLKNQRALEARTRWTSEQFIGRIGHYQKLPDSLSESDLGKVAQSLLPEGDDKSIELLVCYAKGSAKYLAGLDAVIARARYIAGKQQRNQVIVADIKTAIRESVIPSDSALAQALAEPPGRTGHGALRADQAPFKNPFTGSEMADKEAHKPAPAGHRRAITPAPSGPPALARERTGAPELISG